MIFSVYCYQCIGKGNGFIKEQEAERLKSNSGIKPHLSKFPIFRSLLNYLLCL